MPYLRHWVEWSRNYQYVTNVSLFHLACSKGRIGIICQRAIVMGVNDIKQINNSQLKSYAILSTAALLLLQSDRT